MRHRRTVSRSLAFLAAWLLYACGDAPTAPSIAPDAEPLARAEADPATTAKAGLVSEGDAAEFSTGRTLTDRLVTWALDLRATTTDHDARIARAILELTDDRKEHQP